MITLFNFGPNFNLPDPSPFCLKVETYLRATGLEFTIVSDLNNLGSAPKKKLPYIIDNGQVIGDSAFIIEYLKDTYGDPLDQDLNPEQRAIARAFSKMLDENLYFCMLYGRWIDPAAWPVVKQTFFGSMPFPFNKIIPFTAQRSVKKSLQAQGIGRHSHAEILSVARQDLTALACLLGTKDYFLINKPTTLDICAYAFLAQFMIPQYKSGFNDLGRSFTNLVAFVERLKMRYYPEHVENK